MCVLICYICCILAKNKKKICGAAEQRLSAVVIFLFVESDE